MQELDKALAEVTRGLADLTRQVGPEAAEATLKAVQISGLVHLLGALVLLLFIALPLTFCLVRLHRSIKNGDGWANPTPVNLTFIGACILFPLTSIGGVVRLFDTTAWISAIDPAAGLAYRLLEKL